ncbi:unnamed protein product [Merluccius merluccius]
MHLAPWLVGVICLSLRVAGDDGSSWSVDVPGSFAGLIGSCVVIPCSFNYPQFVPTKSPEFTGIWLDKQNRIVYHPDSSKMRETFASRVQLLGALSRKNCTLTIDPVQEIDKGPFHFRIEIKHYNNYSYKENEVSVAVKIAPEPITFEVDKDLKVGGFASASCSVAHTCPTAPPTFTWTHSGPQTLQSHQCEDSQWRARSCLNFSLTQDLHNKSLGCTAKYKGGKSSTSSEVLLLKHAPMTVTVQQQAAALRCLSDGYPAAHLYRWFSEGGALLHSGPLYLLPNVSRHPERLYCSASNTEGHAASRLLQLNASYPPEVLLASGCSTSSLRLSCECVVESSPPAAVSLSRPDGRPLTAVSETHGSVTVVTLVGGGASLGSSDHIYCHAANSLGNTTHTLQVPSMGEKLHLYTM